MNKMLNAVKILRLLLVTVCCFSEMKAMEIIPFVYDWKVEDENSFQYHVRNTSNNLIAFELSVWARKQDKNGKDILVSLKDLKKNMSDPAQAKKFEQFADVAEICDCIDIYPKQIIIPPNSKRSIKLRFRGKVPSKEIAMRVCFSQFPISVAKKVKRSEKSATVNVRYEIWSSLYVTPKNCAPNVSIVSVDKNNITLKNDGNARQQMNKIDLMYNGKSVKDMINSDDLETVVMPGNTRIYKMKQAGKAADQNSAR